MGGVNRAYMRDRWGVVGSCLHQPASDSCGSELLLTAGQEVEGGEAVELLTEPNNVSSLLPQTPFHPGADCADRHLVD